MHLTEKDLPLKLYELSTYSFRYEQRGELTGLKRQRAFTMPDMPHRLPLTERSKEFFFMEQLRLGFQIGCGSRREISGYISEHEGVL